MRTFGIEIELILPNGVTRNALADALNAAGVACAAESYNHTTRTYWKVTTDASLGYQNGAEIVSPILDFDGDGFDQLRKVCAVLKALRCRVNRSCGLHVHHDIRDVGVRGVANLGVLWLKYEGALDSLMPSSRRGNRNTMIRSNRSMDFELAVKQLRKATTMNDVAAVLNPGRNRYRKLNLTSFWRYGTVEFRHHSGTIEFEKIEAWALLTRAMIDGCARATRISTKGVSHDRLENILSMAPVPVRKFYRARAKALAAA